MAKKKERTLAEKIQQYRDLCNSESDVAKARKLFQEIIEGNDPAIIPLLLLMRPYGEGDNAHLEEIHRINDAMDAFPKNVLIEHLAKVAGELCRSSPVLLRELLNDILWSEEDTSLLIKKLAKLPPQDAECLSGFVSRIVKAGRSEEMAAYNKLLTRLNKLAAKK